MKKIYLWLSLFLVINQLVHSQTLLKIGNDTTFCASNINSTTNPIHIGTKVNIFPTKTGFTYKWTAVNKLLISKIFYASDFLDDTTNINPKLTSFLASSNGWLTFKLEATNGTETLVDSIKIRVSSAVFFLSENIKTMSIGDSILADSYLFGGFVRPAKFITWKPAYWFKNPTQFPTYFVLKDI